MTNIMSQRARKMRKTKGPAERRLWYFLRDVNRHGFHFRQQAPIGPYIADFVDHSARLIVEVDGGQHAEPANRAQDGARTKWLELHGYRVLRSWNGEVLKNIDGVMSAILLELGVIPSRQDFRDFLPPCGGGSGRGGHANDPVELPPTPNPSPRGGGERSVP